MSWTDWRSIETIRALQKEYRSETLVETGTFKGVNAKVHSTTFRQVFTCELSMQNAQQAYEQRLSNLENVSIILGPSYKFLRMTKAAFIMQPPPIYYLDAHFYNPDVPLDERFVILKELEALRGMPNCIIVVHDFDNKELGHITYDGIPLDFALLKKGLLGVNREFHFYTNSKDRCDIVTIDDVKSHKYGRELSPSPDVLDNLQYVWSSPEKTYRGILYCTPTALDLTSYNLRKLE